MAGAGNGQPFGDALDDAQQRREKIIQQNKSPLFRAHSVSESCGARPAVQYMRTSHIQDQPHRAVVGPVHVAVNERVANFFAQTFADDEIVDAPARVGLPRAAEVGSTRCSGPRRPDTARGRYPQSRSLKGRSFSGAPHRKSPPNGCSAWGFSGGSSRWATFQVAAIDHRFFPYPARTDKRADHPPTACGRAGAPVHSGCWAYRR